MTANGGSIGAGDAEPLARAFESFVLMYRNHAAREDTIVFPAWKEPLSAGQLREMGEKFEGIAFRACEMTEMFRPPFESSILGRVVWNALRPVGMRRRAG